MEWFIPAMLTIFILGLAGAAFLAFRHANKFK
jgi:hypothetical protein